MELNCPNCMTHFAVPDGAIGPKGRMLKCAKCGHTWRQMPPGYEPSPVYPEQSPVEPDYGSEAGYAPTPEDSAAFAEAAAAADDYAAGDYSAADYAGEYPDSEADTAAMPMEMAPGAFSGAAARDEMPELDFGNEDFDALDQRMVDSMPMESFTSQSRSSRRDDDIADLDDLLAGDPDAVPAMFTSRNDDPDNYDDGEEDGQGKGSGAMVAALVALAVIAGLLAGGWFGRSALVAAFPSLERVYAALGVVVNPLGAGLMFRDVTSERLAQNGTDLLVVRGFIANVADDSRSIPYIRLTMFDSTDAPVQQVFAEPPQPTLDRGATTGFRIHLEKPSAQGRRFEVDWTAPPPAAAAPAAAAEGHH